MRNAECGVKEMDLRQAKLTDSLTDASNSQLSSVSFSGGEPLEPWLVSSSDNTYIVQLDHGDWRKSVHPIPPW